MSLEFCFLLNIILISRLIFTFKDNSIEIKDIIIMIVLQIIGLFFYNIASVWWWLLGVFFLIINFSLYVLEKKLRKHNEIRLIFFLLHLIVLSIFFSNCINLSFNVKLTNFLKFLRDYSIILTSLQGIDWIKFNTILLGVLLVTNEVNIFIRYLFQIFDLAPKAKKSGVDKKIIVKIDKREYNAGRVIGILERVLIYYFVLNFQFAAIGLILTAKSFARFKELENREFAEYVLIGTLLSTLLAMLAATMINFMLP